MVFDAATNEFVLRLVAAAILGGVVGYERQTKHKPAGLRTHMLVSLGAALFGILSVTYFAPSSSVASGIITGIGFIGAGSIIALGRHVQGITTAASLWAVAAIGFTTGLGNYELSVSATIIVFIVLQMWRIEKYIK